MKTDRTYLLHIRDAILRIQSYAAVGKAEFLITPHWQDAIVHQLEIIGEASKRLSEETRRLTPEVPWRQVCGLRDVLIHNYMGVDLEAVWAVVESDVPILRAAMERLLS